jgi:hypothetical protein
MQQEALWVVTCKNKQPKLCGMPLNEVAKCVASRVTVSSCWIQISAPRTAFLNDVWRFLPQFLHANSRIVDWVWNVMAHAQKPDFVFWGNGRVHLNRRGRQFNRLLAAEVWASVVEMLDTPHSEEVWRVLANHSIRQFSFHFSRASPCAITFNWTLAQITPLTVATVSFLYHHSLSTYTVAHRDCLAVASED